MRVLVTGDRHWKRYNPIRRRLAMLPSGTVIIEGGAPGADRI